MTTAIKVYAAKANINLEDNSVELQGFDLSQLVSEFSVAELLEAIKNNDQFSSLVDLVTKEMEKEDE